MIFEKTNYDRGFCRTYYRVVGDKTRTKYCQHDGSDHMFVCSKDGEPSHSIGRSVYVNARYSELVKE